jgi:hypothetical protein
MATRTHEECQFIRAQVVQDTRLPPEASRRDADRSNGVTNIMLAVTIGTLTVFPRFSPVDGR